MEALFAIVAALAILILGVYAILQAYEATKYYDEYKKTGDAMKYQGAIFLLLEAIFIMLLVK